MNFGQGNNQQNFGIGEELLSKIRPEALKDGFTELHIAADFGQVQLVEQLLGQDVNIEATDFKWGNTPLFRAVFSGHDAIVKLLLEKKADPNTANKDKVSALYQAASMGRHIIMRLLMNSKASLENASASGQTPLHGACLNNQTESIKLLLEKKADPNKKTSSGVNALYMATERGNIDAIELLVKGKADIDGASNDGITPLMRAAYKGQFDAVKTLVKLKANVWLQGMGQTAASWATKQGQNEIAQFLLVEMTKQQKKNPSQQGVGFNVSAVDPEGFTLLHRAAEAGNVQLVTQLIELKADIEAKDAAWKNTPLFRAVLANKAPVVTTLLNARAQVDSPNKDGVSPLYQACAIGDCTVIQALIDNHADIDHKSSFDQTPLHAACLNGRTDAVKLLLKRNVDITAKTKSGVDAMYMAAERGHVDVIKALADHGALVDSDGPDRLTPLMRAAYKNQVAAAQVLLDLKADVHRVALGKTAAQWAEQQGNHQVLEILKTKAPGKQQVPAQKGAKKQQKKSVAQQSPESPPTLEELLKSCDLLSRLSDFLRESLDVELLMSLDQDDLVTTGKALKLTAGESLKLRKAVEDAKRDSIRPYSYYSPPETAEIKFMTVPQRIRPAIVTKCTKMVDVVAEQQLPLATPTTYNELLVDHDRSVLKEIVQVVMKWMYGPHTDHSADHSADQDYDPGSKTKVLDVDDRSLEVGQPIGTGSQAIVYNAMWRPDRDAAKRQVAFKRSHKQVDCRKGVEDEIHLLMYIPPHPNIVQLISVVRGHDRSISGMIMEYHSLGSLDRLKLFRVHEGDLIPGVRGLVRALLHLHTLGIVHRDIASRNVLVTTSKQFILADFGLSRVGDHHLESNEKLPWRILSPEILKARREYPKTQRDPVFTSRSDMWAFGVLLWELCNAKEAYSDFADLKEAQLGIEDGSIELPLEQTALDFPRLSPVLLGCLQRDPAERINAREALALLGDVLQDARTAVDEYTQHHSLIDFIDNTPRDPIIDNTPRDPSKVHDFVDRNDPRPAITT